jgi:hypothetical protein
MLVLLEVGRRLGIRRLARGQEAAVAGGGAIETAIFGLLSLLLAFTFSGAGSRFDSRRQLISEETNAIGTAWLRLDLLPGEAQPALRASFRAYLDSRIEIFRKLPDVGAAEAELARSAELQGAIWTGAVAASRLPGANPDAVRLLLPALNEMIDIATTQTMAAMIHPPKVIFVLLFTLALGCSLLAGHAMAGSKKRSWLHILGFALMTVLTVYVILDIEYPRLGLFRLDAYDQVLVDLRASMK